MWYVLLSVVSFPSLTFSSSAEILRVKHLVTVPTAALDSDSTDQGSSEPMEPIRQQLDGQETDMKQDESVVSEQRRLTAPPEPGSGPKLGFGQFIKAVTSPTNVRVTAGGRIVANNTRGTSPTGKMYREKVPGDALVLSRPGSQSGHMVAAVPSGTYMHPQAMYSPYAAFPGAMPFYPPAMQMPMAPMSVGPGTFPSQPGSYFAASSTNKPAGEDDSKANDQKPAAATQQTPNGSNYHGGFFPPMMAMPMQMPMQMPVAMMHPQMPFQSHTASAYGYAPGVHAASYGQATGSVPLSAHQFGHFHGVSSMAMPSAAPSHIPSQYPAYTANSNAQRANVPASSIKLSDVIKKHLEGFREHLKWTTDQVEYNTHQIDEKDMNTRILHIREQIATHERRLREQLEAEQKLDGGAKAARNGRRPEAASGGPVEKLSKPEALPVANGTTHEPKSDIGQDPGSMDHQEDSSEYAMPYKKDRSRSKVWNMKQRSMHLLGSTDNGEVSDTSTAPLHQDSHKTVPSLVKKASGLPMTAALAAPFQPRKHQDRPSQEEPGQDPAVRTQNKFADSALPQTSTHARVAPAYQNATKVTKDLGTPYLEGKLRYGVDARYARDDDFSYPRKLTRDEIKARSLYWVKAPSIVSQGLPKFDGKDFYPASPVKENKSRPPAEPAYFAKKPAAPASGYSDYSLKDSLKATSSIDKVPSDAKKDAADKPPNPYLVILEEHFRRNELEAKAREKRATKSDNINGSAIDSSKSFVRDRHTASLDSEDRSDSDVGSNARPSTSSVAPSADSDAPVEVILFKGRR